MSQEEFLAVIGEFLAILTRLRLSDRDAAALCGTSTSTVERIRYTGHPPKRSDAREPIVAFVRINRHARSRTELRMVDRSAL
jgi:hypothetical protein